MRKIKKQVSVLLATMMAFGTVATASFSASAAETTESTISVTSNLCDTQKVTYDSDDKQVEVTYYLQSDNMILNTQAGVSYDSSVLQLADDCNIKTALPILKDGGIANFGLTDQILFNATNLNLYDYTTEGVYLTLTFDIVGSGDTTVDLDVDIITATTATGYDDLNEAEDIDLVHFDEVMSDGFQLRAEAEVSGEEASDVSIYGDINLDLTSDDATTYTGTVDLDEGTYTFRVSESGTAMCNGSTFTDTIYNIPYYSEFKSATTLNVSGGRYTFIYNASTNCLTVKYKPYSELVEIFGDINVELVKGSGSVFTGSARLEAGSYDFRINEMGTQMCFGYTFDDHVYKIVYNANWTSATTFNANGGLYSFKYDTDTNELTVTHTAEGVGDVRIFGDIELNLTKDYGTLYSVTTTLTAGAYQFRVDELGTTYCNGSTFTESIYQIAYSSDWKSATTFNVEDGKYTFRYDTSTHQLTVLYAPLEQKVSIFGDIELELTNSTGTLYTGTVTLEAGTYAFRVDEFGITMCYGGTYTDTMSYVTYSSDFSSATTFNATGGDYTFTYNTETNRLSVTKA